MFAVGFVIEAMCSLFGLFILGLMEFENIHGVRTFFTEAPNQLWTFIKS